MSDGIIEVRSVGKAFGRKVVFDDLSLSVRRGETLTILGQSGSGKSVLLKMLIGLVDADRGAILVDGLNVVSLSDEQLLPVRQRVSMLFQGGALFDSLTVAANVAYPLRRRRLLSARELADRVAHALEVVGLPGINEMMPAELSGGMKKRVALARAIVAEPDVVLYDEPTTGLDPISTRRIDDLIRSVQARLHATSIVVTHDLASAFLISDRIAMLAGGRVVAVEPTAVFRRSANPAIRAFVDAMGAP